MNLQTFKSKIYYLILNTSLCILLVNCSSGLTKSVHEIRNESNVIKIDTGISNVYLIKGEKPILVDSSEPGSHKDIINKLKEHGIAIEDIALIVLTHGHGDHAGGASYLQSKYKIPVLAGKADNEMFKRGSNNKLTPLYFFARIVKLFSDIKYKPFKPDILIEAEFDLSTYGIKGKVRPMPGHTRGSLVVLLEGSKEALVGDLFRGSLTDNNSATQHFFHEDPDQSRKNIKTLLKEGYKIFYVGHWGPVDYKSVEEKSVANSL